MGRIRKAAGLKHEATVSPAIAEFVSQAISLPISQLPKHLASFPRRWPFPRGDLYHWISLLNRFDTILEQFNQEYGLGTGPQTRAFGRTLLTRGVAEGNPTAAIIGASDEELDALNFGWDGDRHLVDSVLIFSRMLLENCGNRSLYNSSDRLGGILNTTDLSLLTSALYLAVRLAQRYHASRQRGSNASQHLNNALLASHYNIDLEKVQKLANPFVKSLPQTFTGPEFSSTPATTPTVKGKERSHSLPSSYTHSSDMLALATDEPSATNGSSTHDETEYDTVHDSWEDWGHVSMRYYHNSDSSRDEKKPRMTVPVSPMTPNPVRRQSGLSRHSRTLTSDEVMEAPSALPAAKPEESASGGMRTIIISGITISASPIEEIIQSTICDLPKEHHFELLTRLRIAYALSNSVHTRQQMLGIRLLAITNLAYIYPETLFQQKILQLDSDEPRRLQMAYQLTDLIHPPGNRSGIPTKLQTLALGTLEAFSKHKAKAPDVCAALNINVKHGVFFYALRKAAADLAMEDVPGDGVEGDEWREALFSLLDALPASTIRTGETLIAAGLLEILIEILTLRTAKAERTYPRVLTFLNTIIYSVRDAFQTLANSKGLDTISDLIAYEVHSSLERANAGEGLPHNVRNQATDYRIPFYQQQTLRWLFKFVNHMMSHGNGTFDRLLRNLIDSSQLLRGLRTVIVNAKIFGSSVWSGAVNIMSAFIHNEPTSYAVIAEAGLSKGFLEAITSHPLTDPGVSDSDSQHSASLQSLVTSDQNNVESVEDLKPDSSEVKTEPSENNVLAQGILPATDAIVTIPQAFGAICLNNTGMNLFMKSDALHKFFEIFESSDHVKSMSLEGELARLLGSSFDELVRHHPRLRTGVLDSVIRMLGRVGHLCTSRATKMGVGAKLWIEEKDDDLTDSADIGVKASLDSATRPSSDLKPTYEGDGDAVMTDATESTGSGLPQIIKVVSSSSAFEVGQDAEDEKHGPTTSTFINVAMKFLAGFFENSALCAAFIERGGFEYVLDFVTNPSLPYDFNNHPVSQELARVVHMLAEQKPHLVLPSIIKLAQSTADDLNTLTNYTGGSAAFSEFTSVIPTRSNGYYIGEKDRPLLDGTKIVKSLVNIHTLSVTLQETFSQPIYNSRNAHNFFSQVNLADMYVTLIKSLGRLHKTCVWEEILLQDSIPEKWKETTRTKGYGMASEEADAILGFIHRGESVDDTPLDETDTLSGPSSFAQSGESGSVHVPTALKRASKSPSSKEEKSAQFRNLRTLRFLLSQVPSSIIPFFQGLGKTLLAKRRPEAYGRQNAYLVAKAMSDGILDQLRFEAPRKGDSISHRYAYWIVILKSISQLLIEGPLDRPHPHCLTLVLQAFKDCGGLIAMNELLSEFLQELKSFSDSTSLIDVEDRAARISSAFGGIKIILNFYAQITSSKSIVEASQTAALSSNDRDRGHINSFSPPQFLVELRMAVLPVVRSIWESDFMDKASSPIVKSTIEILRIVLEGADEQGAFKRGDELPARGKTPFKILSLRTDSLNFLTAKGYEPGLAREALYRCMNIQNAAEEYCRAQKHIAKLSPNPIPPYDQEKPKSPSPVQSPNREVSEASISNPRPVGEGDDAARTTEVTSTVDPFVPTATDMDVEEAGHGHSAVESIPPPPVPGVPPETGPGLDRLSMNIDSLPNSTQMLGTDSRDTRASSGSGNATPSSAQNNFVETKKLPDMVTINDLDDERAQIKRNLIDRALDVLNVHGEVTFELSDLITAAASKAVDATTMRREIGETLVQSLISFQMDEDFRSAGKKIAAYANLLALVLQDHSFYEATLEELKSNFSSLLGFIKIFPGQAAEEFSPWIGQILLIVEKILAEDVQPSQIKWNPPNPDNMELGGSVFEIEDTLVPKDEKIQLFEAILDILPRIGKDESLVLSVIRTLVVITRDRDIAAKLGEKRNIQRLFLMIKQLAGISNERVQSTFMLLLRHIVEDEDILRQIMRSEIIANFETRPNRTTDTTGYVRQMYHLALRSPKIFVEITNETLEIAKYDPTQRPQILTVKTGIQSANDINVSSSEIIESSVEATKTTETETLNGGKAPISEDNKTSLQKPKASEAKAPVVEHPSGVIHFLLCELLSYKDVEDKEHAPPAKEITEGSPFLSTSDIGGAASPGLTPADSIILAADRKHEKPEFHASQHPIYIHRCFILQCLAELLHCYNRTKIEFINFSRKADPKAMTPSKPRSGVLNYLLNDVVPVGTLNPDESISFRKKSSMSNWAMYAIESLCLRTNENGYEKKRGSLDDDEDTDLVFVRRFVLEHALKAYKDANSLDEPLDIKYARLLCLADLFNRLLSGKLIQNHSQHSNDLANGPRKAIAKLMFEKSFISALTSSIAEIDLNFPGSKRTVKYILRPLKQLTQTAIVLSETSSISSTPGQTDEDDISTASSVSEVSEEREETPDLFRNSTLGMFEPNREEDSSSESSDGDEDEDMYDEYEEEGMQYGDEMERDEDEVISDEEELEGVGPMEGMPGDTGMNVEVVIDGDDDDPTDDDEDEEEDDDDEEDDDIDEDDEVEVIDEITGDSENDSLAGGEDEEWRDEDRDGEDDLQDPESAARDIVREFGGAEAALQHLENVGFGADLDGYMEDVVRDDDDDEDAEEDDEDDMEDEDMMYQPGYEDDEPGIPDPPWGWDPDDEDGMILPRGHHHHHPRRMPSPWTIFPSGSSGDRIPTYRSHRPSGAPRNADDGVNPLLQRNDRSLGSLNTGRVGRLALSEAAANISDYWVHGMESGSGPGPGPGPGTRGLLSAESPVSFVNNLLAAIGQGGSGFATMGGPHGALHFHVTGGPRGVLPRELQTALGLRQPAQESTRSIREEPIQPIIFLPAPTFQRWQEEARILFGTTCTEKAQRVVNSLLRTLVPPAVEKEKQRQEAAAREALEEKARLEAEQAANEKAAKEALEKEQAEREAAEVSADAAAHVEDADEEDTRDEEAMEGIETSHTEESSPASTQNAEDLAPGEEPAASSSDQAERIRTTIRGSEVDITGMGIDLEYLDALPEELREEVLMHQLQLQRSQAAAAGEEPTDISREFLEALPPDIREELLQQEAQDRRRREREEERRRRVTANGGSAARGEEMDPASFLASLEPTLRQAVLMDQDEEVLAHLPQAIVEEARALGGDRLMGRFADMPRLDRVRGIRQAARDHQQVPKKPPRRQIVQMLDKAGVATLLRLMFIPQQGSSRQSLNGILHDVSQNRQNRAEVVSLLLSILQDGSADVHAVERSFTHLSLRAKPQAVQRTPQTLKRALTSQMTSLNNTEMTPLMVIQQCLSALVYLTQYNLHIPSFFLTEHDTSSGLKGKPSRKGKGKETKASRYALNTLLSLIDRKLIMESASCMEQLASLLQSVTHPLTMLNRKDKEKSDDGKITEVQPDPAGADIPNISETGILSGHEPQPDASTELPDPESDIQPDLQEPAVTRTDALAMEGPSDPEPKQEELDKGTDQETAKKQRTLTPPVIPEENLRLVVNILAARECSAKTFRDTLSTINNLSAIPGARDVFGKGLIEQAQALAQAILSDLDRLVPQIQQAESGTDIQAMALAKFSPASSDQAKLLRVLTALNYLFDPSQNNGKAKLAHDKSPLGGDSSLKEDLLSLFYENPTFVALWTKLSDCLSVIRQGEGMLNIATILLPLIEALMVVCKNTTFNAPLVRATKEFAVTSPPPESRMENLFFRFTEDHRKILNDLVRNNPKLMSGTFSLLVKNPKVLEFDNKRSYFTRRLHSRGTEARHPQPPLQLSVRRDQVFLDSFKFLSFKSGDEIKYGKLSIRFHGEEGVDAGGVTREWFQVLSRQMFNPDYALFTPVASDRTTFHPSNKSKVNEEHLLFFKFIGRIIGKALYEGRPLDCHFSRAVYKRILGKTVSMKDMETLDEKYYKSLLWMLENDITGVIDLTFSIETDEFGVKQVVDLVENGRNIPVTEENKQDYIQHEIAYRLTGSVQAQLEQFLNGFHDIVPAELIAIFNEQELELLISGLPDIDVDDWKNNTEYHNYSASSPQIQWFWRAVRSFDKEERAKLLQFVTGTSKVPLNGFGQLEGMNGFSRFNIHRDYGNKDRLPSSHTCFNQLDLPEYDNYDALRQQLYTAMTAGSEYFGFA